MQRRAADSGKESVRPKGGCLERGTLNADRKANRKGAALFDGLPHPVLGHAIGKSGDTESDVGSGGGVLVLG